MKTHHFLKIASSVLILFTIRAHAVVVLNSDQDNFTFQSGVTYFIAGQINCYDTTTIQGGAVLKYAPGASISVDTVIGPDNYSNPPAVFTAGDDDSVGQSLNGVWSGYTGSIQSGGYANPAINCYGDIALNNVYFKYAQLAINADNADASVDYLGAETGGWVTLTNAQIVGCDQGIANQQASLNNCLVANDTALLSGPGACDDTLNLNQCTIDQSLLDTCFIDVGSILEIYATNSIFSGTDWSDSPSTDGYDVFASHNGFYNALETLGSHPVETSDYPFVATGPDNIFCYAYYLSNDSNNPFRNAGTTGIDPALLADIETMTTYTPHFTSQDGSFLDDDGSPDLGYHYPTCNRNKAVVVLNSDVDNFTFQSGMTYFIAGQINCDDTTTIQGGAVLKYSPGASLSVGTVIGPAISDPPAILTAADDDSAGQSLSSVWSGYTGTIQSGGYANPAINCGGDFTLNNVNFKYAQLAINADSADESSDYLGAESDSWVNLTNAQIVGCVQGIANQQASLNNCLVANDGALLSGPGACYDTLNLNQCTIDQSLLDTCFIDVGSILEIYATNSIFSGTDWSDSPSTDGYDVFADYNGFYNALETLGSDPVETGNYPFATTGPDNHYLNNISGFRNAGTTVIDPGLLVDIETMTTYTPQDGGYLDNDGLPDLGYHYPPGFWVDKGPTALQMAQWLMGPGVTINNAQYTGDANSRGIFGGGNQVGLNGNRFPIDYGIILASGDILNALGPNNLSGAASEPGTSGDPDLANLVGVDVGDTFDAAVLEFDFVSTTPFQFQVQYTFASEEYPEYIGFFADVMGIFVTTNHVGSSWTIAPTNNLSFVPGTILPVCVTNINGGDISGAYPPHAPVNPQYYVDNADPGLGSVGSVSTYQASKPVYDLQYDGFTTLLTAQKNIPANVTCHVKIAVEDYWDEFYDSAVFIKTQSVPSR